MTAVPVTDIPGDYGPTSFSEDNYPLNKHYELTKGQLSILRTVNDKLLARTVQHSDGESDESESEEDDISSPLPPDEEEPDSCVARVMPRDADLAAPKKADGYIIAAEQQRQQRINILVSDREAVVEREPVQTSFARVSAIPIHGDGARRTTASFSATTPSLGAVFDDAKRVRLLEEEVKELRKKCATSQDNGNLENFTKVLFGKAPRASELNKRVVIVNYATLNNVTLSMEDLEKCSDEEVDRMYSVIRRYNETRKKKILVTNVVIIGITVLEHVLVKLGFSEVRGLSADLSSELIDVEIGEDCEHIAERLGFGNSPVLNVALFVVKLFVRKLNLI
ncbi:Virion formation [Orf virus]|uniref:Virion formation protein n=3 Tax=Orf virus TaxID=10258 RepID=Q6TVN3_ORFSA|nr:ORF087 hypothetical protein [Orf virus]AAR98312.1 ORF087 hypothetical protein [Orf virus]AHZ33784.1 virion formation [Orf virus]AKU76708.1 Virion formation [Orf virus]AKU76840.1 Virion formation [Orf virus]AKU76964.1 Virion formation [Orf virus]